WPKARPNGCCRQKFVCRFVRWHCIVLKMPRIWSPPSPRLDEKICGSGLAPTSDWKYQMKKLSLLAIAALLGACHSMQPAAKTSLDGEVFYLQRIALPPTAILSVSLQDVSLADAPAVVLDEQIG